MKKCGSPAHFHLLLQMKACRSTHRSASVNVPLQPSARCRFISVPLYTVCPINVPCSEQLARVSTAVNWLIFIPRQISRPRVSRTQHACLKVALCEHVLSVHACLCTPEASCTQVSNFALVVVDLTGYDIGEQNTTDGSVLSPSATCVENTPFRPKKSGNMASTRCKLGMQHRKSHADKSGARKRKERRKENDVSGGARQRNYCYSVTDLSHFPLALSPSGTSIC